MSEACRVLRFVDGTKQCKWASSVGCEIFIENPKTLAVQCNLYDKNLQSLLDLTDEKHKNLFDANCATISDNKIDLGELWPELGIQSPEIEVLKLQRADMQPHQQYRLFPVCDSCPNGRTEIILVEVRDYFDQIITMDTLVAGFAVNLVSNSTLGDRRCVAENGIVNVNNTRGASIDRKNLTARLLR